MFFSADRHFIVKEITKKECVLLRSTLREYVEHCHTHPNTLLPRVYMLLKVAVGTRTQDYIRVVVMQNVFDTPSNLRISESFDLKGSTR